MGVPKKFDAVIALGKNWRAYPQKDATPENWRLRLSIESKMTILAAGEMFQKGLVGQIIISTGKTAGAIWPSEAGAMNEYLRSKYPHIPNEAVILEEKSIDTIGNAEETLAILRVFGLSNIALLTVGFHLERSKKIFRGYGIRAASFASEEVLCDRSRHYRRFVRAFLNSKRVRTEKLKEMILRGLLLVDARGKMLRLLTKKLRHATE